MLEVKEVNFDSFTEDIITTNNKPVYIDLNHVLKADLSSFYQEQLSFNFDKYESNLDDSIVVHLR